MPAQWDRSRRQLNERANFKSYRGTGTDISAEVKTEETAAGAQERFMAAIESVSDGFALFDADDRMVFCNTRFKALNPALAPKILPGITFEELLRDNIAANRILDALDDEEAFIRERMAQHRNPTGPLVQQRRDGRWLELREERTPEGSTFLVNTDITERKRAEKIVRQLYSAIEVVAEPIALYDADDRIVFCNQTYRALNTAVSETLEPGTSFEEHLRAIVFQGLMPEVKGREEEYVAQRMERHRNPRGPFAIVRQEGIQLSVHEHKLPDGGTIVICADITERKRAEDALQKSEALFRSFIDNLPSEIFVRDTTGHFTLVNRAWERVQGVSSQDVIGKTAYDIYPTDQADIYAAQDQAVLETGQVLDRELKFREGNGSHFVHTIKFPIPGANGEVTAIGGIAADITERKRAEEALQASEHALQERVADLEEAHRKLEMQGESLARLADDLLVARDEARGADRAKSEFLAAMSHELRTPLNAVIGFSEILKDEIFGPIGSLKYRGYANDINESALYLLGLINDLLDLSKIESGTEELCEDTIEIPEIIRSSLKLVEQRAEYGRIKLKLELSDQLPALRADERKLKQILVNLLSNAVKFTDAGGEVTLRAWCRMDSGYVLQITDTGIGITPENIPKALLRFRQIDADLNRQYEGTGLGLPLTKALVEQHGGTLDLHSEVSVGTTVTVRFPSERIVHSPHDTKSIDAAAKKAG